MDVQQAPYFPNQEKAEAPPIGFAFVFTVLPPGVVGVAKAPEFSFVFSLVSLSLPMAVLIRLPSSKKRLLLLSVTGAGLAVPEEDDGIGALAADTVLDAVFGFKTLMPVSLRWYTSSRFLPALAQSRDPPADDEGAAEAEDDPSRRQLLQMAGVAAVDLPVVVEVVPESEEGSSRSVLVLSIAKEGRAGRPGRESESEPAVPDLIKSVAPVSAATMPGGLYLPGGGLAAADDTEAVLLPRPSPFRYGGRSGVTTRAFEAFTPAPGSDPLVTCSELKATSFSGRDSGMLSLLRSSSYSVMLLDENRISALCARRTSLPMKICIDLSLSSCVTCSITRKSTRSEGSCGAGLLDLEEAG